MRPAATFARAVPVRPLVLGAIAALLLGTVPASAAGGGVKTSQAAMLTPVGAGVTVEALITVGEAAGDDGYIFESIPDGISISTTRQRARSRCTSTMRRRRVPFPYPLPPGTPTAGNAQNDFDNAQVSRLILNQKQCRRADRQARHHERPELPALLLQLPGHRSRGVRSRAPVHERGERRLGQPEPARRGRRRSAPPTAREAGVWSWPTTSRPARTGRSGAWAATTTRTRCAIPGFDRPRAAVRRRHVHQQPVPVTALFVHRPQRRCGLGRHRARLWAFVSDNADYQIYEDFVPETRPRSRATSSKCRA